MSWLPSHYKLRGSQKGPTCLICQTRTRGPVVRTHVALGVAVLLCERHASVEFRRMRGGRDFTHSLFTAWQAAGCLTQRRLRALDAVRREVDAVLAAPSERARPGSYAWAAIRRRVEEACRRGHLTLARLRAVVDAAMRAEIRLGRVTAPSDRTLLRWQRERRWEEAGWVAPPAPGGR